MLHLVETCVSSCLIGAPPGNSSPHINYMVIRVEGVVFACPEKLLRRIVHAIRAAVERLFRSKLEGEGAYEFAPFQYPAFKV